MNISLPRAGWLKLMLPEQISFAVLTASELKSNSVFPLKEKYVAARYMKHFRFGLIKAILILTLATLFLAQHARVSMADPTFRVLSENALPVRSPDKVILIAIARAGNRLVAAGEHGVIIFSDDNGQSWSQASVPVNVTMTSVAFASPAQGWAAGAYGVILHTTDGGKSWRMQISGTEVNQIMLANAQQFSAKNIGNPAADIALRRANIFSQGGPDRPFLTILPESPEKAIVFGSYRMAMLTADGGQHWQDMSLQIGDPVSHNLYGEAILGSSIYLAAETGIVLRSLDGGQTFTQVAQPAQATLFGILATRNGGLLTYGVAGALFLSSDSGSTWNQINAGTDANLTAGRVLDSGQIIVTGENGFVYISRDNGLTFHQTANNLGMEIFDCEQAANGNIVFVGDRGVKVMPLSEVMQS